MKGARCRECNATLTPGSRYCTGCGAPVRDNVSRSAPSHVPWYLAGGALVVLLGVLIWPKISGKKPAADDGKVPITQLQGVGEAAESGAANGPLAGTPREQADRLFNRIMSERENGDTARAKFFLPMGIQAYQMAGDIDADGLYHLSLLQAFNSDYSAARTSAERILVKDPNHLLGLSAAATAARDAGDNAAARKYYSAFLTHFDAEMKTSKEEYQDHARMLPELKKQAQEFK